VKSSKGFTLVELLVTMALVSLMLTLATYSFNQYSSFWAKELGDFDNVTADAKFISLMDKAISNALPYFVENNKNELGGYFLGRDEGFTFVTTAPIFSSDSYDAVVRILKEQINGAEYLVYEEAPLNQIKLSSYKQELDFKFRVVLFSANSIAFSYYGAESIESKYLVDEMEVPVKKWYKDYDGEKTKLSPEKLAININETRFEWSLATESQEMWGMSNYYAEE
tara:strand:+ start:14415 stop:15086 length:672 start_codon:yes stop_codon:yes gene_type:complete